ncbi:MAG: DUF2585 domain-containing protein [Tabrizicola flagellatus]|uniref:DUF2585 domain-containing protein n=1 Tax=Tabrizicola flagellatus TaxID=2593021 RepID=UPI00391BCA90
MTDTTARDRLTPILITLGIILLTAASLLWIGREPICKCGYVKLWHGEVVSAENSQHLSDWYTPSHIIHGFLFYGALWLVARRLSFGWRLALATLIECGWEIIENSDAVIERYRTVTISLDYYGDSVINTMSDVAAMILGFWLASRLPVWATVALIILFEVATALIIRDGLALNVLMLLYPVDWIADWQAARPV